MNSLYINLINFNNNRLAGAGYFFKRIISNIDFDDAKWNKIEKVIILSNKKVDPLTLFAFRHSSKLKVVRFPLLSNFLFRIFFEQLILPLYLIGSRGVFFSPTPAFPLLISMLNRRLFVIPTIHDMIPFKIAHKYSYLRSLYVKFLSHKSARLADKILTVSEFSKEDIREISDIKASKIEVIYNFIPELDFKKCHSTGTYFVTVCTIEPGKNIETMLKGFHLFINSESKYSNFKYKIVGQFGWQFDSIVLLVKKLNLVDSVEFTGYLSDDDKNNLIANCAGMIYLSKYEGFGIPPLEAMYYNKASIVSDRSSLPEVVGDAGIIQDADDFELLAVNLKKLLTSADQYTVNIPKQIRKFDPHAQVSKFEESIINSL